MAPNGVAIPCQPTSVPEIGGVGLLPWLAEVSLGLSVGLDGGLGAAGGTSSEGRATPPPRVTTWALSAMHYHQLPPAGAQGLGLLCCSMGLAGRGVAGPGLVPEQPAAHRTQVHVLQACFIMTVESYRQSR